MRPVIVICALCLLAPVVLALLPSTGWIVRGDCASLIGLTRWDKLGLKEDDDIPAPAYYDRAPTGVDRESKLTALSYEFDKPDFTRKLSDLGSHWDDSDFLASFVLQACGWATIKVDSVKKISAGYPERTEQIDPKKPLKAQIWSHVRKVCDRAATLEPDNAFFPVLSAAASDYLGDPSAAAASLAVANRRTVWNDHVQHLQLTFDRSLRREFGYRGPGAAWGGFMIQGIPAIMCLRGLAAATSRLPFDRVGIESRRAICHVAMLAYAASDSYPELEESARLVNRVAWFGVAKKMSQEEARRTLLASLSKTAKRIEPLTAKHLESSLREMIAAEDFRSASHLGPSWEGTDIEEPEPQGESWWLNMTYPEGAGQNATSYTLAGLSVAAGLAACLLVFTLLRRVPPRLVIPQIFRGRWAPPIWTFLGYAGLAVAVCALVLSPPLRRPYVWFGTVTLMFLGTLWIVSQVSRAEIPQVATIAQRLAIRFLAVVSLVVCFGIIWQLGVSTRWERAGQFLRTTAAPARKWAHEHPPAVNHVGDDVWWTGA